jgi:hypothetical protein
LELDLALSFPFGLGLAVLFAIDEDGGFCEVWSLANCNIKLKVWTTADSRPLGVLLSIDPGIISLLDFYSTPAHEEFNSAHFLFIPLDGAGGYSPRNLRIFITSRAPS